MIKNLHAILLSLLLVILLLIFALTEATEDGGGGVRAVARNRKLKTDSSRQNVFLSSKYAKKSKGSKSCKDGKGTKGTKASIKTPKDYRYLKSSKKSDCSPTTTSSRPSNAPVTNAPTTNAPSSNQPATQTPTVYDCSSQRVREDDIDEIVVPLIVGTLVDGSAESLALDWLIHTDTSNTCEDDGATMKERFILALLYYRMGGENWEDSSGWLSTNDHCTSWSLISCNDAGRVQKISMNRNNVIGEIPPEISNLDDLSVLKFYNNAIEGTIPSSIYQLNKLTFLDVEDNILTGKYAYVQSIWFQFMIQCQIRYSGFNAFHLFQATHLIQNCSTARHSNGSE